MHLKSELELSACPPPAKRANVFYSKLLMITCDHFWVLLEKHGSAIKSWNGNKYLLLKGYSNYFLYALFDISTLNRML